MFDKEKRSEIMSHIRSKNTKPEVALRKALFAKGFRYRINEKRLTGKPDIVLPRYRTVVFVHGCFWHGHQGCRLSNMPKSNTDYWRNKIQRNIQRDNLEIETLNAEGWQVIVVWECEIKTKAGLSTTADRLERQIQQRDYASNQKKESISATRFR